MSEDAEYIMDKLYKLLYFLEKYGRQNPGKEKGLGAKGLRCFIDHLYIGLGMTHTVFDSEILPPQ